MDDIQSSSTRQTKFLIIKNRLNNLVLDVEGGKNKAGARVTAWLAKNWSDQLWYEDTETGTIRWRRTRLCLEIEGDVAVMKPYCHGNLNQLWKLEGCFIRHRRDPERVISIAKNGLMPGAKLTAQMQSDGLNQQFDFIRVPGLDEPHVKRPFYIVNELNSKVLDIRKEAVTTGTEIIIYNRKKSPAKNQQWYFDREGFIRSNLNDFIICSQQGSKAKMMPHSIFPSQEWTLVENAILSKTGECLEIGEQEQYEGANVYSSKFYDTTNQRWRIEYL